MTVQWEYDLNQLIIDDVYNLSDCNIKEAKAFMNKLGQDGWEIIQINSAMLGTKQHITYTCKRQK